MNNHIKWPDYKDYDSETHQLIYLVENSWCWNWPGWKWIAFKLNDEYENFRTPAACRSKYNRLTK